MHTPVFPLELEREIFTTAAIIHEDTILTLLRVAHRVWVWIEPLLYRTLVFSPGTTRTIRDGRYSPSALRMIQKKSPTFIHKNVRHLMCTDEFPETAICVLLSLCTGVQNLVLWNLTPPMLPFLSSLRLTYLTLPLWDSTPLDHATKSSFVALTHLRVRNYSRNFNFPWINSLPSLTHLCVENPMHHDRPFIHNLLQRNEKLQVLVCTLPSITFPGASDGVWIDDERIVMMRLDSERYDPQYERDWKLGRAGGRDFWVHAEEFLAKKRGDMSISLSLLRNVGRY
ncbi:hypothetical protein B0H19DRAFT_81045 [Mycena capillaripes]|nr:hypothetical protein B0H19DRAFT_81045 [Mycena capillaripes]